MALVWQPSETAKLIDLIESFPVIWKTDHPSYGRRGPRESAHKKVAELFPVRNQGNVPFHVQSTDLSTIALTTTGDAVYYGDDGGDEQQSLMRRQTTKSRRYLRRRPFFCI